MTAIASDAPSARTRPAWTATLLAALPRGKGLPRAEWERRHRGLVAVLWLHVVAVPIFGLAQGFGAVHTLLEASVLLGAALAARFVFAGQRLRSAAVCLGLMSASGILVHFSGGFIEFHFHFFVMLAVLALYVDWWPFLLAVAYVLGHHGVVGVLDPAAVYNHPDAIAHPWRWAGIHAGFVLAAAGASIYTWRMVEEEMRRRTNIERVTEAALAKLPLRELLDELLARVREVLRADVSAIWLWEDGYLVLRAVDGATSVVPATRVHLPTDDGLYGRIVAQGRPASITDDGPDDLRSAMHRAEGVRAVVGVPLLVEGTLVGVLELGSVRPRRFSTSDVDLLQLVADRIGPAVDRARLYEQEHEIAATLQRSLLPKRLPDLPGVELVARYLPAGDEVSVGGDWYDAMELPGGRLALVMGDVTGHGSEAAALMGQLRTGLRAYATEGHAPEVVVARLNALLAGLGADGMATLLYLDLDLATWRGELVTAGHPPPVLLEPGGASRFVEGAHGAPLGASRHTTYTSDSLEIAPGALLMLYTDGLVERRGASLPAALDALRRRVADGDGRSARAIVDDVVRTALDDGPLGDDVAVLGLRRLARAATTISAEFPAEAAAHSAVGGRSRS